MKRSNFARLAIAFLGFMFLGIPSGILGVAWPSIRQEYGLPQDALGWLAISMAVGYVLASFFSGKAGARLGLGPLLMISAFTGAVGLMGTGATNSWPVVVLLGLIVGQGTGTLDASVNTSIAMNDSPRMMIWLHAGFGLGATLGPVLMSAAINAGSWRSGYTVVGVMYLVLGVCFAATLNRWLLPGLKAGLAGEGAPVRAGSLRLLRRRAVWFGMLVFLVYVGVEVTAGQWVYTLLTESRGVPPAQAAGSLSLYWAGMMIPRLVIGITSLPGSTDAVLRGCMAGIVAGTGLICFNAGYALSLAGIFVLGLSLSLVFPMLISATPGRVGGENASNVIGFQVSAGTVGAAVLPALSGILGRNLGLEAIAWLMVGAAVVLLILYERWRISAGTKSVAQS